MLLTKVGRMRKLLLLVASAISLSSCAMLNQHKVRHPYLQETAKSDFARQWRISQNYHEMARKYPEQFKDKPKKKGPEVVGIILISNPSK
jgi:hypothetical protein